MKRIVPYILLFGLMFFHAVLGVHTILNNQAIAGSDEIDYIQYMERFENEPFPGFQSPQETWKYLFGPRWYRSHPNLPYLAVAAAYNTIGRSLATARMVHLGFFLGTLLLIFLFGKSLMHPWCGLMAAVIYSCYPLPLEHSRFFNVFVITPFMVTLTLYILSKTKMNRSGFMMLIFGVCLGLGLVTERGTGPLILFAPVGVYILKALYGHLKSGKENAILPALYVSAALAIAILIAGPYLYFFAKTNMAHNVEEIVSAHANSQPDGRSGEFIPASPFFYVYETIAETIGLFMAGLLIGGIPFFLVRKKNKAWMVVAAAGVFFILILLPLSPWFSILPMGLLLVVCRQIECNDKAIIIPWFFAPLILFSLFASKNPIYLIGILPAVALITAAILYVAANSTYKKAILAIALLATASAVFLQLFFFNLEKPKRISFQKAILAPLALSDNLIPHQSPIPNQARRVLDILPKSSGGILIYIAGPWQNDRQKKEYFPASHHVWESEFQAWINYLHPGFGHVLVFGEHVKDQAQRSPDEDWLMFLPLEKNQEREVWNYYIGEKLFPIAIVQSIEEADRILKSFGPLPGKTVDEIVLRNGRKLLVTVLENTSKPTPLPPKFMPIPEDF